ncbi:MAG: DmsE family decaheme c-type cytochrome [Thermoanaerobaculia bacterium]
MRKRYPRIGVMAAAVIIALASWASLAAAPRASRHVDWAALNPAFQDATFVKDTSVCLSCHEDAIKTYEQTTHHKALAAGRTSLDSLGCESCHGPRSKHVEDPGGELALKLLSADQRGSICLQCHEGGKNHMHWSGSAHDTANVTCDSCHVVMQQKSETALLARQSEQETCYQCHADVRGQMQKASHHPVREAKMSCSSCHNPHGTIATALLRGNSVNDTCYSCHADKRGPFIWEHPPVRDNCVSCHNAHGSNNRSMLLAKGAFQCTQCHSYGGHINVPRYNRVSTPTNSGCVNCHMSIHGSNHPSGAKLTR